jgi:HK97 gp10 family phage protein
MSLEAHITSKLPRVEREVRDATDQVVETVLDDIIGEARRLMRQPHHGFIYRRKGGGTHLASAPGEAPAIDTAALYRSLQKGPGFVSVGTEYAGYLEYGTMKMEPRPFMGPAADYALRRRPKYEVAWAMSVERA